jgi:hypothetical protein
MLPYIWDMKNAQNMSNQPAQTEVQVAEGVIIYLAKHAECGWYVETSDKYVSDYYATKKEAAVRRSEIKNEIKKGWW